MSHDNATRPSDQQSRRQSRPSTAARTAATLASALILVLASTSIALAAPPTERSMHLDCQASELVVMRSNGSSWWGLDADGQPDGTVYVTTHLNITFEDEPVYNKSYGNKTGLGSPTTCTADHFGFIWVVELVQTR